MLKICSKIEKKIYKILLCDKIPTLVYLYTYMITFGFVYIFVISQYFSYVGYVLKIDFAKIVITFLVSLLLFLDTQKLLKKEEFSSTVLVLLDIGYAVPMMILYEFGGMQHLCFLFFIIYWFFLHIGVNLFFKIKSCRYICIKEKKFGLLVGIVVLLGIGIYISYKYNSFHTYLSLDNVYQIRAAYKEKEVSVLFGYIYSILSSVIPVCITICLCHKKYVLALVFSYIQINLYSIAAIKKYLLFLFLAWVIYYIFLENKNRYFILPCLSIMNVLAIMEYELFSGMPQIANYLQRRTFLLPVRLYTYYFDFFSTHIPDYFQQSFLRHFGFQSLYKMPIANIIGGIYEYEKSYETTASNGLCGDAIANLGWLAVLIYPLVLSFILNIFNYITEEINCSIKMIVGVIFFVFLTNGSLFSNLLSNGFGMIWVTLWIYSKAYKKNRTRIMDCNR